MNERKRVRRPRRGKEERKSRRKKITFYMKVDVKKKKSTFIAVERKKNRVWSAHFTLHILHTLLNTFYVKVLFLRAVFGQHLTFNITVQVFNTRQICCKQ